jgi:hypothetical protein
VLAPGPGVGYQTLTTTISNGKRWPGLAGSYARHVEPLGNPRSVYRATKYARVVVEEIGAADNADVGKHAVAEVVEVVAACLRREGGSQHHHRRRRSHHSQDYLDASHENAIPPICGRDSSASPHHT